jgi:hypothetical protein
VLDAGATILKFVERHNVLSTNLKTKSDTSMIMSPPHQAPAFAPKQFVLEQSR